MIDPMHVGIVRKIWRYPVKSLAGEPLESTAVTAAGLPRDREHALFVRSGHEGRVGKTFRGKEHNLLHTLRDTAAASREASERGVEVDVREDAANRFFDAAPVSLIFDRWVGEVSDALAEPLDPLRWRPNFYVEAAPGFALAETDLVGEVLQIDGVVLRVRSTIGRCVTTTYDVVTGERWDDVLTYVAQRRGNVMGIYCDVLGEGVVREGDAVALRER